MEEGEREAAHVLETFIYFKELTHMMWGLNKICWTNQQAGNSGMSWCYRLGSEFHVAGQASWKLRQAFCTAVLRPNSFFYRSLSLRS